MVSHPKGAIVRPCIVAASVLAASGFGTASKAQAQIVYGYSTPLDMGALGPRGVMLSPGYSTSGYTARNSAYNSAGYYSGSYMAGGSGYSPLSLYMPLYPPMGSNYRLSPVRMYGYSPYGMSSGYGAMNWMNSGYGGYNSMWMRRP